MSTLQRHDAPPAFLLGGGQMGERIRAFDWARTPLGAPRAWPQSLKTLTALLLASRQPMFIAWGRSQVWLYNDAFTPILGEKHPQALGRHALDEVWSEGRPALAPLFARVFAGEPVHMDDFALMLDRHGRMEESHFAFSYTPVREDSGAVAGLFGVCIETTDRIMASRRELAAIERQRRMFEQAPSFVCMLGGPQHIFEFVNKAHRELFNSGSWIGKPVREAFPDLAGQGYVERLDEVYRTGKRYVAESASVWFSRMPGHPRQERLLHFIYEPVVDDAGAVTGIFCEGFDVTEAAQTQNKLREADRRKDEFLATLAHELRNPLAPLRNALHLLPGARDDSARTMLHGMMQRQVDQLVRLVDDLLDVARISQGKIALRADAVEIGRLLDNSVESTAATVKQAGGAVAVSRPAGPVHVQGDLLRLTQVVCNLLNNAVKFSEPGGVIALDAALDGEQVVIAVRDRGIGIPEDKLDTVFEMFSQLDNSLERTKSGLGLGLALARQLVEMHGGTIEASSEGPGRGAVFTVRLPRMHAVEAAVPGASAQLAAPPPLRIVLADDNRDAADSMAMLLRAAGHQVEVAYDGAQALATGRGTHPDVMLVDIGMPGMNGYDLARAVRSEPWSANTLIIALTGWGQENDKRRSRDAGIDHHLVKPVEPAALDELLRRITPAAS